MARGTTPRPPSRARSRPPAAPSAARCASRPPNPTGAKTDAATMIAAAKGLKWESPPGPMMIDPETRDVVQNVYIRRVQKVGNELVNVPFDTIPMVKDPAGERRKTK